MEEEPEGTVTVRVAVGADVKYVYAILEEMERSAKARGTGIARRTPQSLCKKIYEGKAVIAVVRKIGGDLPAGDVLTDGVVDAVANGMGGDRPVDNVEDMVDAGANVLVTEEWAGFSYIEAWSDGAFVSNSGLIVNPVYRKAGVGSAIKSAIFALSRQRYPHAQIFSITTGAAVMKLNHKLGFQPVTYSEITRDGTFWDQCRHCVNYPILESNQRKMCLCTAMLFSPGEDLFSAKSVFREKSVLREEKTGAWSVVR